MKKYLLVLLVAIASLSACKKDKSSSGNPNQPAIDDATIQAYIKAYNDTTTAAKINATKDDNGIYYQVITQGAGGNPTSSSTVSVNYSGKLLNGTIFDKGTGYTSPLSALIKGWQLGIPYVKAGGRILLLIPSGLAYGSSGSGKIPANSPLSFTIDLLSYK